MSYKNLVDNSLKLAFNSVKDLAKEATLTKKTNPTFNFGTGESEFQSTQNVSTKIVVSQYLKNSKDRNSIKCEILLKANEVGDLNNYSTISFDSNTWNFADIQKNDGFILIANVYREA
jgi:hypothetical protein